MHRRQIVHRDLKPSNIMLTTNGMHAKVVDFGLSDSDSFAFMKIPAGTRLYASPELMAGERVDARSDLWSLGVILREFGSRYARISAKCMRRNPSDRYDSAWEVMQDVLALSRSNRKRIMVAAAMVSSAFIGVYAGAVLKDIIFEHDESASPAYDMSGLARPELLSGATLKVEETLPEPLPVMMLPAAQPYAGPPQMAPEEPCRSAAATEDIHAAASDAGKENVMNSSDLEDLFRKAVEAICK
ncbi:MAG: serine/threonine-protein kinase [Candidatus Cryptobacteroides sp.]